MGYRFFRNSEGYHDPTAGLALQRISREERRKAKTRRQQHLQR